MLKKIFFVVFIVLIIGYIGYLEWKKNQPVVPQVRITQAQQGPIVSSVLTTGIIVSQEESTVFAKTAGIISNILINEGDSVKKGDLLIEYQQMEALNTLAQAQDQVALAKVNYEDAQDKLSRAKELYTSSGIPEIKVKETENLVNRTKIQLSIAQKQLELTEKRIRDFTITAPQDGTLIKKIPSVGSATAPGTPLFIIADTNNLEIEANIDEVDSSSVHKGQHVTITSAILPTREFTGVVDSIADNATIQKGITVIKTTVHPSKKLPYKIGNIVDLEIVTDKRELVVYIPIEAIHENDSSKYVYLYENKHAKRQSVTTGISNFNYVEITEGITAGDTIIVSSDKVLHNNEKVQLIKAAND